jgi:hypothetical protein
MDTGISRRQMLAGAAAGAAAPAPQGSSVASAILERHDRRVDELLRAQETNAASRHCGAYPDEFGVYQTGSAGGILEQFTAALLHPGSKFHADPVLAGRMRLAARFLEKAQSPQGNISLLTTNFNSPPDTGFVVHNVATAATIATRRGARELAAMMEPFLRKAGAGMAAGGIHTPNHRWVVCAALAQLNELFPHPAYTRRIGQWLAEGIDIDEDGQFSERSTAIYNPLCDRCFIVMAEKLKRPELLDPARRNLDSMLYLLHPGFEVVTEISRRQDANERGDMGRYWFPLRYFALRDGNGRFAAIERSFAATHASLSALMEYPELERPGPQPAAPPEDYERRFRALGVARIRRGPASATLLMNGSSRFFVLRRGDAVVNAVRFASAFFGKGQFVPDTAEKRGDDYHFHQDMQAGYMQPLDPARPVGAGDWGALRPARRQSEICRLRQEAWVREIPNGFRVRVKADGTADVPLAVEINLREGGRLEGCVPARAANAWVLASGYAVYRAGADAIRFGPGAAGHRWTQVRGAQAKLDGPSVYITGDTPFDHTIEFTWV